MSNINELVFFSLINEDGGVSVAGSGVGSSLPAGPSTMIASINRPKRVREPKAYGNYIHPHNQPSPFRKVKRIK